MKNILITSKSFPSSNYGYWRSCFKWYFVYGIMIQVDKHKHVWSVLGFFSLVFTRKLGSRYMSYLSCFSILRDISFHHLRNFFWSNGMILLSHLHRVVTMGSIRLLDSLLVLQNNNKATAFLKLFIFFLLNDLKIKYIEVSFWDSLLYYHG